MMIKWTSREVPSLLNDIAFIIHSQARSLHYSATMVLQNLPLSWLFSLPCTISLLHLLRASATRFEDNSLIHWLTELLSAMWTGLALSWTCSNSGSSGTAAESSLLLLLVLSSSLFLDSELVFEPYN